MKLEADNLEWSIGAARIIDRVSLQADSGTTLGLLGPNGSGKSSLLRLLAGLRRPNAGVVRLGDDIVGQLPPRLLARRVGLVEQDVSTDQDPLVRDVVDLGRIPHRKAWAAPSGDDEEIIARAAQATRVLDFLDRRYSTLSGGERQRVQLARALAQEPSVLLLDEPTNHLDVRHQIELLKLVRQAALTVVMALHDLNLAAAFCDHLVVLKNGRVVANGSPSTVLRPELIEAVYGVSTRVSRDDDGLYVRFRTG